MIQNNLGMVKQLQVIILKNEVFANNHNGFDAIFRVTGEFEEVLWERKGEMFSLKIGLCCCRVSQNYQRK